MGKVSSVELYFLYKVTRQILYPISSILIPQGYERQPDAKDCCRCVPVEPSEYAIPRLCFVNFLQISPICQADIINPPLPLVIWQKYTLSYFPFWAT